MQERHKDRNKYFREQAFATEKYCIPFIQQICENKLLSKLPFYHLLPRPLYKWVLRLGGESAARIEGLMEVRDTRISIGEFYRLIKKSGYGIDRQLFFLFNPNYQVKFGLKPRKQPLYFVPFLRNFIITTCYFVVSPK